MHHLARNGWVCFTANYRLSPGATFPHHLVDAKAALAWIRNHAQEYDVDPSQIAVAGGSAGGHLAALVGLTEGRDPSAEDLERLAPALRLQPVHAAAPPPGERGLTYRVSRVERR